MVRKTICIIFLALLQFSSFAQELLSPRESFEEGNKHYENAEYFDAIERYENALKNSKESNALLHYNLGNAYFKSEQIGRAILNYEKALKINPDSEKAKFNLSLANARIVDNVEASPSSFFYQRWIAFLNSFGADTFAIIALSLLLLTTAGFYLFITGASSSTKKSGFILSIVFIVLFAVSSYLSLAAYEVRYNTQEAIILEAKIDVKTEPNATSNTAFVMHEGAKVRIEDEIDNWVEISLENGNMGWIEKQVLGFI